MLRQLITLVSLLVIASMACAGEAARIVFVAGNAHIANHVAALGDAVNEGDEIATGADGYLYLKTIDSGFLILRPNSRAHITAYHIDQQSPANSRVKLELLSGVARSISGLGVKQARQNFRFNTPVAAIGVRGTDFTVFTDQQISRVTVISGGVIVSGFGGACLPEGGGPCEGATSKELFADKAGQLLQIQKGQLVPKLLKSNEISPDLYAPPRGDEPLSKTTSTSIGNTSSIGNASLATTDLSLDPQKSNNVIPVQPPEVVLIPPSAPASTPVIVSPPVTPPVVPPVVTVTPSPPEIIWGRWTAIANLPADSAFLAQLTNGSYAIGFQVGPFDISRVNNTQLVLPSSGQASFTLQNSEAYIAVNGVATPASVQNAQLNVNFAQSSFSTSLTVQAPGLQSVNINGQGSVTVQGYLVSSVYSPDYVKGYLGGSNAQQAGYIFTSLSAPVSGAYGATTWSR